MLLSFPWFCCYSPSVSIRFLEPKSLLRATLASAPHGTSTDTDNGDQPPPGMVKSILPCTPLAIVKCLEYVGVYNRLLPYGDRAYGRTITVINRWVCTWPSQSFLDFGHSSEVVGRPLAALLANDGARVLSVDIDSIQVRVQSRLGPILFMNQDHYLGVHQTSTGHLFQLFIVWL